MPVILGGTCAAPLAVLLPLQVSDNQLASADAVRCLAGCTALCEVGAAWGGAASGWLGCARGRACYGSTPAPASSGLQHCVYCSFIQLDLGHNQLAEAEGVLQVSVRAGPACQPEPTLCCVSSPSTSPVCQHAGPHTPSPARSANARHPTHNHRSWRQCRSCKP